MKLTIDFETRSRADLKKVGAWRYAEDPSTDPLVLALKIDSRETGIFLPKLTENWATRLTAPRIQAQELVETITAAEEIEAHNAEFEQAIWHHKMVPLGFPAIPDHKWRCTAARAALCSLPRGLDDACTVLGLPIRKDRVGYALMLKFCKPRKKVCGGIITEYWHEDPTDFEALCRYCMQDVEAEYALSQVLPELNAHELAVFQMTARMNKAGILVDESAANALVSEIERCEKNLLAEWRKICGSAGPSSPKQVQKTLEFFKERFGVEMTDLTKHSVNAELENEEAEE